MCIVQHLGALEGNDFLLQTYLVYSKMLFSSKNSLEDLLRSLKRTKTNADQLKHCRHMLIQAQDLYQLTRSLVKTFGEAIR